MKSELIHRMIDLAITEHEKRKSKANTFHYYAINLLDSVVLTAVNLN